MSKALLPSPLFWLARSFSVRISLPLICIQTILFTALFFMAGCQQDSRPIEKPNVPKAQVEAQKPANFIICIDNSKSIRGQEQVVIRETTMLLADLAEVGDRVSVVTFGRGAKMIASKKIQADSDRIAFKTLVQENVHFDENFSDIRAGLQFVANDPTSPIKQDKFIPHIIILSDGKLEPADKKTLTAFNELLGLRENELADINLYTVVLGDKYSDDIILKNVEGSPLNGLRLMKEYLASSRNHFFHAHRLDELLNIAVNILNQTKGSSAIGDEAESNQFRIDDTVEIMTLIVRKESMDGKWKIKSSDIELSPPETTPMKKDQTIYHSQDYQYFDLYVVRNPSPGIWSIKTPDGLQPEVLSKIVTPIELQVNAENQYYRNESKFIRAWIFNKRIFNKKTTEAVKNQKYQIKAHLAKAGNLASSNIYVDFHIDPNTGQGYLNAPSELLTGAGIPKQPALLNMEVIVRRFEKDTESLDPWFIRRSGQMKISIIDPFFKWLQVKDRHLKYPFIGKGITLGAELKSTHEAYPEFEMLPRLKIYLDHYNTDDAVYKSYYDGILSAHADQNIILFQDLHAISDLETGNYRYRYEIEGMLKDGGPVLIKSPEYYFTVESLIAKIWWMVMIALLIIIFIISSLMAKLKGTLTTDGQPQIINARFYESDAAYQNRFNLKAKRFGFFKPAIILTATQGSVVVNTTQLVTQGQKIKLVPGETHEIYHDENDVQIEHQLLLNV
jgi:Mg-chelatase subunit ChlD